MTSPRAVRLWPIGIALVGLIGFDAAHASAPPTGNASAVPVLVELFTAEGCSSCPPADVLLEKILEAQPAREAELVGLGEHVDYWNELGWKDRFSSAAFTKRQQQYAARSRANDVYTPQMVIDGGEGFVGTDLPAARRAIERAAAAAHGLIRINLERQSSEKDKIAVALEVSNLPALAADNPADLLVAVTEDRLRTEVKRGENQGRTLTHTAVVREMVTVGAVAAPGTSQRTEIHVDADWRRANVKIVAFVQQRRSRRIVATGVQALPVS